MRVRSPRTKSTPRWVAVTLNDRDHNLTPGLCTAARAGVRDRLGSRTQLDQVGLTADLFPHPDMTAEADDGPGPEVREIDVSVHSRRETARDVPCSQERGGPRLVSHPR
jgi:hypothetical protein